MKGIVFNILNEMVEQEVGLAGWDTMLDNTGLEGIYIATETYDDAELLSLVDSASSLTGIPTNELIKTFGEFMIPKFAENYGVFFEGHSHLRDFLLTVDEVIHVEVRKLYPEAGLPEFAYDSADTSSLTMIYKSPRKLCALAEGLISGSAKYFNQSYSLEHEVCMHHGADHCELKMLFES